MPASKGRALWAIHELIPPFLAYRRKVVLVQDARAGREDLSDVFGEQRFARATCAAFTSGCQSHSYSPDPNDDQSFPHAHRSEMSTISKA